MKAQTSPGAPAFAQSSTDGEAWCFEQDGMLHAICLMAEKKTTRVLMMNSQQMPVGVVETGPAGITYRPLRSPAGS